MKKGFATAIVLIFLGISSIILLSIYEITQIYRQNTLRMSISAQLETDALNTLNCGIGYLRNKSAGVMGFRIMFTQDTPNWFDSDYINKLNDNWKFFVTQNVKKNSVYKILTLTPTSNFSVDQELANELTEYKNSRNLSTVELYAFELSKLSLLIISRVEKNGISTYAYGIVGSKLLNQYIYFTNKEIMQGGSPIFFSKDDFIDGPFRTHDYINVNNVGGKPKFSSTIEIRGIKDRNGREILSQNYQNYVEMLGNPPFKILSTEDLAALDFQAVKNEYKTQINSLVNTYDFVKNNRTSLSGLKFNNKIVVSFNYGQSNTNYDIRIIDENNTVYTINWEPSGPPKARIKRQYGSQQEEFVFEFNGTIYSSSDITIDEPNTSLSKYRGNYTLYSEKNLFIKDRIIPVKTYDSLLTQNEQSANGEKLSTQKISQIKDFVSLNETSSLNLIGEQNVRIVEKLNNMKIFASIFTFDGSFTVDNYNIGNPTGQLFVFGSIMQNVRGPVGTFNPSTGQTSTGYYKTYVYDPRIVTGAYQPAGTPTKSDTIRLFVLGLAK